jgi:hypothetical protein
MSDSEPKQRQSREYPPLYERIVPIAMVLIAVAVIVLLLVILGVVLGLIPGN